MIRAALIVLGLILGLALAAVTEGRIRHLRAVPQIALPGWTTALSDDSGLRAGGADGVALAEGALRADLGWRLRRLGLEGAVFTLSATAPGSAVTADLVQPWDGSAARLGPGGGDIDLGQAFATGADLAGLLRIESLSGSVDARAPRLTGLALAGQLLGLRLDGTALGEGTLQLVPDGAGGWSAEVLLEGEVLRLEASAQGLADSPLAEITATLTEGPGFPRAWRDALAGVAAPTGDSGWLWTGTVDLAGFARGN